MNKCFVILVAAVALICAPPAASATTPAWNCPMQRDWCGGTDGAWWQHLSATTKLAVVQTTIAAFELGYNQGQFATVSAWVTAYDKDNNETAAQKFHSLISGGGYTFGKSDASYVAAIDAFYKKYPAKINFKVAGVMRCLRDHPEATCDEIGKSDLLPWPTGV